MNNAIIGASLLYLLIGGLFGWAIIHEWEEDHTKWPDTPRGVLASVLCSPVLLTLIIAKCTWRTLKSLVTNK